MALGGWRVGLVRLRRRAGWASEAGAAIGGLASEIWSALAAPMQHAAAYVLSEPPEVVEHVAASRRLHRAVSRAAYDVVIAAGARCRPPSGAFYLYPDFAGRAVRRGAELADHLLEQRGIAVLAGEAFGDDPAALRFRMATSLLYGDSDEQQARGAARATTRRRCRGSPASLDRMRDGSRLGLPARSRRRSRRGRGP